MLSIGKLATGQARYYLDQADARVDRATSVASGVDDYYLAGMEAAGEWHGGGIVALGLRGAVEDAPLHAVLGGADPRTGLPLRATRGTAVPGFDLTFSAPKSASVLFGIADESVRRAIQDGHDVAVRDALGYLERMVAYARRGHGGQDVIAGTGLVAAAFRHRTSRAGDPQLHTHVLVANLVEGADGRWSALDGRRIYAHAKTASYLYEARLRAELTERLGVEWTPVVNGLADIAGVPRSVLRAFSRRRVEIEAELARVGERSAAAAQVAALTTRKAKDRLVDPRRLMPEWRERAATLGLDAEAVGGLLARTRGPELDSDTLDAVANELAGPRGLTERFSSFSRRDVIRGWCDRLPAGMKLTSQAVERLADRFLDTDQAVPLIGPNAPPKDTLRRADGVRAPLLRDERRYSTPELLAVERRIVDAAVAGAGSDAGIASDAAVGAALTRRPFLAREQAQMVRRLTRDGGLIVAVVGKAGAGKTTALTAAREAWEASGLSVVGAAVARRAARELQESAGIASTSLSALLFELRRGGAYALANGAVVVLDEASMVASRDLDELVCRVKEAGGKLVLCGDHRQLPSIRAGGAFHAIAARSDVIELNENRRQTQQWERQALDELRDGIPVEAIRIYEAHDRLVIGGDRAALMDRLVADWWSSRDAGRTVMIGLRRSDVRELNARARELMRASGALGPDVPLGGGAFAVGDRVVLRRNDRRLGVANGELGVITAMAVVGPMSVALNGRVVGLPRWYLDAPRSRPTVQHAYAITGHVAQGMTVDQAFVLGSRELYREWGYTAMSRGRHANRMYVLAPDDLERQEHAPGDRQLPTAAETLATGLQTRRAQTVAVDTALERKIRRTSSAELRDMRRALLAALHDSELARAIRERDRIDAERDSLRGAKLEVDAQLRQLDAARPAPYRTTARARHRHVRMQLATRSCALAAQLEAARDTLAGVEASVNRLRRDGEQACPDVRLKLQTIDDELSRRASLERSLDPVPSIHRSL